MATTVIAFKMSNARRRAAERWLNCIRARDAAIAVARELADLGHCHSVVKAKVNEARTMNHLAVRWVIQARYGQ